MSELLAFDPGDFWYIKLDGYGSKFPPSEWGGYSQSFVASDDVYSHRDVVASEHDFWGICGCQDFDHGTLTTLVFDLDVHKAGPEFDPDRIAVPEDTLLVKTQNGGFHVYFKVHAERGALQESDFRVTADLDWDVDIRGSAVNMHVVAPTQIPGVNSPYEVVENNDVTAVMDPGDAASRIQLDGEPLVEYDPGGRVGASIEVDRDVEPPAEMPTCYHRGLQLRAAAPEDHPNTHKVNVLTALCGLAAGYEVETMLGHFCDEYPPGEDVDRETTRYHLQHIADHVDRGEYSPPALSTLREFGILGEDETCECDIPYHGHKGTARLSPADHMREQAAADGGATAATGGDGDASALSLRERVARQVIEPLNPPDDSDVQPIAEEVARERLADLLCDEYDFLRPREDTRGWRDTLYVYSADDGIYEPHGETFVQQEVERVTGAWASNQRVREIVGKIERRSRINKRRLEPTPERLVVANGVLDLTTGELSERTPDEFHQTMVDIEYHPDATCPAIDAFLHDVVADSDVPTLYRLIAHTLFKEYKAEKAAMLLGDGRNGKSVFLSLVESFLGEWNVSNQSLQKLNEDQWAAHNLLGKLANVHPDMSDQTVQTMQMFKKLTGRDTVAADVKFEEPVHFENYATLIFACNRMPVLNDDTRGNWRRWLLIDFPNTFEPDADETRPKEELLAEMTTDAELQGLLARCVDEIQAWADGRAWFPNAPSWEEARRRIRRAAEPVYDFAAACLEDSEGYETAKDVRRCYRAYAKAEGLPTKSREEFGRELLNQVDHTIEKAQKRVGGQRKHVYQGVEFTSRGKQLLEGGDDTATDGAQSSVGGGPQGRAQTVVELCAEHATGDGGVGHDLLVGLAMGAGMDRDTAEQAIAKAKNQGDLYAPDHGDEYLPT